MIVCGAAASYCAMAVFHSSGSASGVSGTCQASQTHIHQLCCQFLSNTLSEQPSPHQAFPHLPLTLTREFSMPLGVAKPLALLSA
jgi:hypothetical protein